MIENTGLQPVFETERLRVFKCEMQPNWRNSVKDVFVAFRTDEDRPMICANAVICPEFANWVEWVEVTTEYRRQGFGTELLKGIERYYRAPLDMSEGSNEGEMFINAWEDRKHGIEHNAEANQ